MNIITKGNATPTKTFASEELSHYLGCMLTDTSMIDIVLTTDPSISKKGNDAFRISIDGGTGSITGSNDRSILLGIYDYLHHLGARFLAPVKKLEYIPQIDPHSLSVRYEKEASYKHRGVCIEGATSYENIADYIDWLPKVGFNAFFLQFKAPYSFLSRWYNHELNPYLESENYEVKDSLPHMEKLEDEMTKRNLLLHKVGHGWTGESLGFPTFDWSMTKRELTADSREICAQIDGVRALYEGMPANTNLCYSKEEAKERFVNLVVNYAKENPNVDYIHVWLADAFNNVCECEDCVQTTVADQYIGYLNEIDTRLCALNSDAKIVFLLYQELLWPALKEKLHNPDRFAMIFAPISRTFETSYDLDSVPDTIPAYVRNQVVLPVNIGENMAFLKKWQESFKGDSFVYDYPLGRAHYGDLGYYKISKVISDDIKKLSQMGLDGYMSCQELRACMPNALPNYCMGRTLFDDTLSFDSIAREYYEAAYGKHASLVADLLKTMSKLSSTDYVNGKTEPIHAGMHKDMETLIALCEDFSSKHTFSLDDYTVANTFIEVLLYHIQYVKRFAIALYYQSGGERQVAFEHWKDMRDFICKHELEFQPYLDVFRIIEVSKRYTRFYSENETPNLNTWHD